MSTRRKDQEAFLTRARKLVVAALGIPYGQGGQNAQLIKSTGKTLWQACKDEPEVVASVMRQEPVPVVADRLAAIVARDRPAAAAAPPAPRYV